MLSVCLLHAGPVGSSCIYACLLHAGPVGSSCIYACLLHAGPVGRSACSQLALSPLELPATREAAFEPAATRAFSVPVLTSAVVLVLLALFFFAAYKVGTGHTNVYVHFVGSYVTNPVFIKLALPWLLAELTWSLTACGGLQFRTLWALSKAATAAPLPDSAKTNKNRLETARAID